MKPSQFGCNVNLVDNGCRANMISHNGRLEFQCVCDRSRCCDNRLRSLSFREGGNQIIALDCYGPICRISRERVPRLLRRLDAGVKNRCPSPSQPCVQREQHPLR